MRHHWSVGLTAVAVGLGGGPASAAEGRWEGQAQVPGVAVPVVVDIAAGPQGWIGSITLPGRGVRGAPLQALAVHGTTVRAEVGAAGAPGTEIGIALRQSAGATLVGELSQGGHAAPLTLQRTGPAQVEPTPASTPIAPSLLGTWVGRYDIGFGPRDVTLRLDAAPDGREPKATITVVGRRTVEIAIDLIVQHGAFVTLAANAADIALEGPWALEGGQWSMAWRQGPFEAPLLLRRQVAP
jgi:hypothetical protein